MQQAPGVWCLPRSGEEEDVSEQRHSAIHIHEEHLPHPGSFSLATGAAHGIRLGQGPWHA